MSMPTPHVCSPKGVYCEEPPEFIYMFASLRNPFVYSPQMSGQNHIPQEKQIAIEHRISFFSFLFPRLGKS